MASRSPWLHEQEAAAHGLNLSYSLFDFTARGWSDDELPHLIDTVEAEDFSGINVTFPFKQAIIDHLDGLSDAARQVGAVNTVAFVRGQRIGHNTDVTGFAKAFASGLPGVSRETVVQLGAGGAGSATAFALLESGVGQLLLFDPDPDKLLTLVSGLQSVFGPERAIAGVDLDAATRIADGIVNATPIGMAKQPGIPLPARLIDARHWVADIVYFPLETELLHEARGRGCKVLDGSGMAIHQAAEALEIFTGLQADRTRMQKSFVQFVSEPETRAA